MIRVHRTTTISVLAITIAVTGCARDPLSIDEQWSAQSSRARVQEPPAAPARRATGRLLACPWGEGATADAVIGPDGGTIEVAGHEVRIPAGAVATPTRFTVTVPAGRLLALGVEAEGDDAALRARITATITYARCNRQDIGRRAFSIVLVEPSNPHPAFTAASTGTSTPVDDPEERKITFEVVRRGTYAVAY